MKNIFGKIQVMPGKGSPDIIIFLPPELCKLLKLRNNPVITSRPIGKRTHKVMHLAPSVQTENHVGHFPVGKLHLLLIQQNSVCGQGKPELLVMFLFQAAAIFHNFLNRFPIHQPKKSTSRFLRDPEFSTRKSSACFPTSTDISPRRP